MTHPGRAVRRTAKAAWINGICLLIVLGTVLMTWVISAEEKYPDAWQGMAFFAAIAIAWAIRQEWAIRKQVTLMRFGEVTTATITGAWSIYVKWGRIHFRSYQFSTATGRAVEKITIVNSIDALVLTQGAQVEVVYDPRRPRRATFSQNIWAAALTEADAAR